MDRTTTPQPSEPWYAPGLNFTCTQCGQCCTGEPGFVWVDAEEIAAIANYLQVPLGEVQHLKTRVVGDRLSLREYANGDCIYLDPRSRGCTIYPVRPKQCRTWPFWKSNLATPENWSQVQLNCPGAGRGEFVPLEEIQNRVVQIDL